jgi:protein LSM14
VATPPSLHKPRLTTPSSYIGTLHSINSDDSTVSLENVKSFGTEHRKTNPDEFVPGSEQLYEYIVFRGTDVKDLRIEEGPAPAKEEKPPAVPNDPAILGVSVGPTPQPFHVLSEIANKPC